MHRNLSRRLASVAKLEPLKAPVHRTHPGNVLNVNPVDVTNELEERYQKYRLANFDTRIRVNHFLLAVFLNDTTRAVDLLQKFMAKCKVNRNVGSNARNIEVYVSCLMGLVAQLASGSSTQNIHSIRKVVDEVSAVPKFVAQNVKSEQMSEIHEKMVIALIRCFLRTENQNRVQSLKIASYVKTAAKKLGFKPEEVTQLLHKEAPDLLPQMTAIWRTKVEITPVELLEGPSIDSFKGSNGFLNYSGVCSFIAQRFPDAPVLDSQSDLPMYEIFDLLAEPEREEFFQAYLVFNKGKQLQIEEHCGNLHEEMRTNKRNTMRIFNSVHRQWLDEWHDSVCVSLKAVMDQFDQPSTLDNANVKDVLQKHSFFLSVLPLDDFVSMVLSTMLTSTLPTGHDRLNRLTGKLSFAFTHYLRHHPKFKHMGKQFDDFFRKDDTLDFFASVIKVVIDSCCLPSKLKSPVFKSPEDVPEVYNSTTDKVFSSGYMKPNADSPLYMKVGVVRVHPYIDEEFKVYDELLTANSYHFPMLYPPLSWKTPTSGGHFNNLAPLVRSPDPETTLLYMNKAHKTGQLASTYESLNLLGSVPWAVNRGMLEVFSEVMSSPDGFMTIPPPWKYLVPELPDPPVRLEGQEEEEFLGILKLYRSKCHALKKTNQELQARRGFYNVVHKLAEAFNTNGDVLYYPQNLDFRGRVYPSVSFLSNQSEDMIRSMLMFWKSKPLGPNGFDWLKYQLANMFSKAKLTMEELIRFVEENRSHIEDSACLPLAGQKWWMQGDAPWQSLALCKEMRSIWNYKGDIKDYRCRIPIHMDGTCNGLQHYAALGADKDAALSVNLLPSKERHDVYLTVLLLVEKKIEQDLTSAIEKTRKSAEKALPLLSRKLIKQTVMTTVYGVTQYGASLQILNRISELPGDLDDKKQVATYVAGIVLGSISELFAGAKIIQNWLWQNCNRCIRAYDKKTMDPTEPLDLFNSKFYRPMMWTTLAGFPVIQLYKHALEREIVTPIQKITVKRNHKLAPVDIRKLLNAVAPNFIHSLDAIHLQMTCLASNRKNVAFVAVHDSFWTHPCDVETLSRVLREEFIRLHSSQIITNLREDLVHTNKEAFQLVWVYNLKNPKFIEELKKLRKSYKLGEERSVRKMLNLYLTAELQDNSGVAELLDKYNPKVWFQTHLSNKVLESYEEPIETETSKYSLKSHTPVLTPVKILKEPPIGSLDLEAVLDSKFFFS